MDVQPRQGYYQLSDVIHGFVWTSHPCSAILKAFARQLSLRTAISEFNKARIAGDHGDHAVEELHFLSDEENIARLLPALNEHPLWEIDREGLAQL